MARLKKKKAFSDKNRKKVQASEALAGSKETAGTDKKAKTIAVSAAKPVTKGPEKIVKAGIGPGTAVKEPNFFQRGMQFFREVRVELKKVTWPNRGQTAGSTVVVIILVFIIASFLGLVDFGLSKLVQIVLA